MSIEYVEKSEWLEHMQDQETMLIGAFAPPLTQITMEVSCSDCGRPMYVSPYEKGAAKVFCILCRLKFLDEADRETLTKALMEKAAE
jgi:hypothetical protein